MNTVLSFYAFNGFYDIGDYAIREHSPRQKKIRGTLRPVETREKSGPH